MGHAYRAEEADHLPSASLASSKQAASRVTLASVMQVVGVITVFGAVFFVEPERWARRLAGIGMLYLLIAFWLSLF